MVISEEYADFICGCGAGCLETILLYPQSKLIFRQQLHGVFAREAIRQVVPFFIHFLKNFSNIFQNSENYTFFSRDSFLKKSNNLCLTLIIG